jgi:hypothetical protein
MPVKEKVSLVSTGHAIASLRESDFDTASAVGEVVDNALQAEAEQIQIAITETELAARGRRPAGTARMIELAFGDDGTGMDAETLHRCLQLGFSTRYNDRSGIGRFGVGVTLGAISQCTRIELYSRESRGNWLHTYIDLAETKTNPYISEPVEEEPPTRYKELAGKKSGTVMIWAKCDNVLGSREELEHWLARTYRKFIGESTVSGGRIAKNQNVRIITVNGVRLKAFDPLYAIPHPDMPAGTHARLLEQMLLEVPVPTDAAVKEKVSPVTIQMSILPEEWRPEKGAGGSPLAKRLRLSENEGFSVLRAQREVFYDVMPHFEPVVQPDGLDRWWSAEIAFDPPLDKHFSVRNVKRGARFLRELREKIQERMRPTILEARREVKRIYDQNRVNHTVNGENVTTEHTPAEKTVQAVAPTPGKAGREKTDAEKAREIETIVKQVVQSEDELAAWRAKIEGQPCTVVDQPGTSWKGPTFIDVHPQGGRTIIEYNRSHEFFLFVYDTIKSLQDGAQNDKGSDAIEQARALKTALDLLFMAYAQAVSQFDMAQQQRVDDILRFLENNWGLYLSQYVRNFAKTSE